MGDDFLQGLSLGAIEGAVVITIAFQVAAGSEAAREGEDCSVYGESGILDGTGAEGQGFNGADFTFCLFSLREVVKVDTHRLDLTEIDRFAIDVIEPFAVVPFIVAPS